MYATLAAESGFMDNLTNEITLRPSFEELYRSEYPNLVAVATALAGNVADGEDLVQDTMVKLFLRWNTVGQLERPGGWCHRVLVNACRSWWRRRVTAARYLARQRRVEATTSEPAPEFVAFWAAVRELPERPRQAVALYYAGELTAPEVASILGVPEGTVRSDLSRARVVLAKHMEPQS